MHHPAGPSPLIQAAAAWAFSAQFLADDNFADDNLTDENFADENFADDNFADDNFADDNMDRSKPGLSGNSSKCSWPIGNLGQTRT